MQQQQQPKCFFNKCLASADFEIKIQNYLVYLTHYKLI